MGKLTEHVRSRLSQLDRDEPAGPLASWRWLWRAVRATGASLPMAAVRFSWLVVHDLALLTVWAIARPFRRSRAVRGVTAMAAVALVALLTTTGGGPEPESRDLHPGLEMRDGMVHADIEFGEPAAEGWFRFGGEMIRRDMLPTVIESHGVESVRLRVTSDIDLYYTFMFDMMGELRDLGVRRFGFGPPPDSPTEGLVGAAYANREFIGTIFSDLEAAGVRHVTLTDTYDDGLTPDDIDAGWTFDVEWFPPDRRVSADGRPPVFRLPANMFGS